VDYLADGWVRETHNSTSVLPIHSYILSSCTEAIRAGVSWLSWYIPTCNHLSVHPVC